MNDTRKLTIYIGVMERIVAAYRRQPAEVAEVFDALLDRTGNSLGWLRELAQMPAPDPAPAKERP